ncbi:RagB/SusD family nutrient uptake outer membrane protein [Bacteroides sp. 51]|uniref:RagB/SusD family nutrient uptake outer membrane protein n=1 Tax=Bacteroides sp. 51 TaxID=2302938 RepID=UPI0013CFBEDB|nr:RagB/SusD family nutrient uptake outer membrane protein [Bacteroides sp. 51]NDV83109.1 RagB/SusD family nutrient uptake outer membrane protein [Bacteroides sp. 51]
MKKIYTIILTMLWSLGGLFSSCTDYLDVVPDNIATLDNSFTNRNEAEKYLFTCYSYLPDNNTGWGNTGLMGADEVWVFYPGNSHTPWQIARGNQNANDPYMNCWDGSNGGKSYYKAIRDCNIFLEYVEDRTKVQDLSISMRLRWISEVKFLKAYYHFQLFRMYGPIVIADKNLPVYSSPDEVRLKRSPVDEAVQYISDLLDEAITELPQDITNRVEELGRVTKPAALMLKAKLWLTAASPLFNGNPDYADFVDKDGEHLFNSVYDVTKWEKAASICKAAIESCEENFMKLYTFTSYLPLSDDIKLQMSIRNSFSEKWNSELIWGLSGRRVNELQVDCMARVDPQYLLNMWAARDLMNPTLHITDQYYTENGVPMNEDKIWNYSGRYDISVPNHENRFKLVEGYATANIHFGREPRFYANLAFDGSLWFMENNRSDDNAWTVKARVGQPQAKLGTYNYTVTGYWTKKLVNWKYVLSDNSSTYEEYPWPEFRLSDLYLMYAEALNETGKQDEAIVWLDKVRERAGLKGVKESWTQFSTKPNKFASADGLREIIHQERTIELMFEGQRFWDIRRWKEADKVMNKKVYGWDIDQEIPEAYYRPKMLFSQEFVAPRDYLFPIKKYTLLLNTNLVQNPGW